MASEDPFAMVELKSLMLSSLLKIAIDIPIARAYILSHNLTSFLTITPLERGNIALFIKYASVVNLLSSEESNYPRLQELGVTGIL
jgi:hypothetical protein